ncbi:HK97-gp10 family putative phage morphogenesis protein [Ferribacterium limneticum]|uniref:HK97-gp10 family putative phage morphogenesis protein n=1 Tax=Ferribacterium limneticum TaxID=76259 RepID=UPI001CF9B1E3|nr:HK97-gp10 family putative phage morphogenesis protein [Ferribacterium limneticum]UCV27007.1 HK97 gp10 family phage protein [Ferribacterium limneticum]UCV30924.1 HK97 gp10 family phage protein [Ferribacterium limneticum]
MLKVNQAELAAILERLKETAEKVGKKGVRTAARKAMVPVRDEVRANAPEDLSEPDDIRVKSSVALVTKWRGNKFVARVGIKGGAKKNPNTPFYWRMHEFGTKNLPARPFMAPALESNAQEILDTITEELRKALFK